MWRYFLPCSNTFCYCWWWEAQVWCLAIQIDWSLTKLLRRSIMEKCVGVGIPWWTTGKLQGLCKTNPCPCNGDVGRWKLEVMKAKYGAKGRCGTRWKLWHQGCSAHTHTVKTWMFGSVCPVHGIYHRLIWLPGKSCIAGPLKTLYWVF